MSITLRPYRSGGWEADITIRLPDGSQYRERKRAARFSKSSAQRWAQDRERYLLQHGPPAATREVPTLETFAPRFVDGHARANRHKPSGIASIESILKWHLVPTLGARRLDAITNEQVQQLKLALPRLRRAASAAFISEGWSGLRESNPSSWLGKPEHYHYAKPACLQQIVADLATRLEAGSWQRRI